ncbi:MAG: hypothetical protein PHX27_03250 [Candidatus ainarchaeum sp.]|nr:hypothetical protein [Candidatus ainarchaeum sp.]
MDKRWKNLGVILIIIIVLVILFLNINLFFPQSDEAFVSDLNLLNDPYVALAGVFENNDINIVLFRQNELTSFDNNKLNLVYSEDKLINFKTDLLELKELVKTNFENKDYSQFNELVDIYVDQINFNILFYDFSKELESKMSVDLSLIEDESVYCDFVLNNYPALTVEFDNLNSKLVKLVEKNHYYYEKYNILVIDYDFEFSWETLNYAWDSMYKDIMYCDERSLVE